MRGVLVKFIQPLIGSSSGGREYSKNCSTHLRIAHFIQNSKKKQSIFLNSSMKSSDLHNYRLNPEPNRQQVFSISSFLKIIWISLITPLVCFVWLVFFYFVQLSTLSESGDPLKKIDYHRPQIYVPYFPHHVIPFSQPPIYHSLPFRETREQVWFYPLSCL